MKRRQLLKYSLGAASVASTSFWLAGCGSNSVKQPTLTKVSQSPDATTSHWLGKELWGNRLQDWQQTQGRIECLNGQRSWENRTACLLTKRISAERGVGRIQLDLGRIDNNKTGYADLLLGIGQGKLDQKGCSIVQRASGTGGGILAVVDEKGHLSFRDFNDNTNTLVFKPLTKPSLAKVKVKNPQTYTLDLSIQSTSERYVNLTLTLLDSASKRVINQTVLPQLKANDLTGGISLVSSPHSGQPGARWWFNNIQTGGNKILHLPEYELGPVMGCMYSLNRNVLKLTTQLMPVDLNVWREVQLEYKAKGQSRWQPGPTSPIENGYVGTFRVSNWDYDVEHDYRIVRTDEQGQKVELYSGTIVKDHGNAKELRIALYSCIIPTSKSLDGIEYSKLIPQERILGRYTPDNILFPHKELVDNCDKHQPDLYLFVGDRKSTRLNSSH